MLPLRPTTNLKIPHDLMLNNEDNRRGFLHIYNVYYRMPSPLFFIRMFFGGIAKSIVYDRRFGSKRALRQAVRPGKYSNPSFQVAKTLLSIRKVLDDGEPHFAVKMPIFFLSSEATLASLLRDCIDDIEFARDPELTDKLEEIKGMPMEAWTTGLALDADTVISNLQASGPTELALDDAFLGATIEPVGTGYVAFVTLAIESYEAAQLTTTPFEQIRPNDLYSILLNWANGYYGAFHRPPKSAFPIGKVAATLPSSPLIKPRVNAENITIDADGKPILIPAAVNNIQAYDQMYLTAGYREDGSFQLFDPNDPPEVQKQRRLPAHQPIFVDWPNAKFTYSDGNGYLQVLDLAQCRVPNATQLVRIAKRTADMRILTNLFNIGSAINAEPFSVKMSDVEGLGEFGESIVSRSWKPADYIQVLTPFFEQETGYEHIRWCDLSRSEFAPFKAIYRYLLSIGKAAYDNMESVYAKYSVLHTLKIIPYIIIAGVYSKPERFAKLEAEDASYREVYRKQGADPNWQGESLPLKWDKLGQLPHQKRTRNQLRDFPHSAILAIPAGGRKTPLIVMDILKFIKANKGFPYLIMCPSHLVAQYVSEIALFTSGKLNAIPVNTATLTSNSLDRVGKMIQSMPRNTVVIVDYDVTSRILADDIVYGSAPMTVYHVIEFLRQFNFQYVALDEAHYLRNDSRRTEAVQSLILDVPYKRLASGTFAHDSMSDLAHQMGVLDPTMFGTRDEFNARFGAEVSGGRVIQWRPGAEQEVNNIMRNNLVVCRAHRKEWAALLPPFQEHLHVVSLTPNQKRAYDMLLDSVMEELQDKAKDNPVLKKWLEAQKDGREVDAEEEDDIQAENLEALLKTYLARLERFVTAMGRDDWGKAHLTGDDLISPKITEIIKIIQNHVNEKIPGKIIVFTNYVWSAEEIYRALPAAIKSRFVLYKAADKVEAMAKFSQAETIGMVGVSASMDTGLNLQSASRLIREGLVWNPGTLEQGDARIGRPQLKTLDKRDFIYYDIVAANNTIDMSKIVRIYSKLLSVEKYNNAGDSRYEDLPDLPVIKMSFDNIAEYSDVNKPEVREFIDGYIKYKKIRDADYVEYREKHKGTLTLEPVESAADPKDAFIMSEIPYVPGGELAHMDTLGLVRLDHFLNASIVLPDTTDAEYMDDDEEEDRSEEWLNMANQLVAKMPVNCQFGEGRINRVLARGVSVRLPSGENVNLHRSTVFVKQKPVKNVRQSLAALAKLKLQPDQDIPLPFYFKKGKVKTVDNVLKDIKTGPKEKVELSGEIYINVVNGYLGLEYYPNEEDASDSLVPALQSVGFRFTPPYMYAEMPNGRRLLSQFKAWREKGFKIDDTSGVIEQFKHLHELLVSKKLSNEVAMYRYAQAAELRNFLRLDQRPSNKQKEIKPYPLIDNGIAYIALPIKGQSATKRAITVRAPGVTWHEAEPVLQCFTLTVPKTLQLIERIQKNGIQISNLKELKRELTKLRRQPIRTDSKSDI